MTKVSLKLIAAAVMLAITASMVVTVSYAWMTVSKSPAVNGIQVMVGGGQTILLAPDVTQIAEDGTVIHYPGKFDNSLSFSDYEAYTYLRDLGGLLPVSTADGLHWVTPTYYTYTDEEVIDGSAYNGQIKPVSDFAVDSRLTLANLPADQVGQAAGHYVYLDFWIVSPGAEYKVRVSSGDTDGTGGGGSFLIGLPEPVASSEQTSGYTLQETQSSAAASARIGFLVNQEPVTDDAAMLAYQQSGAYADQYTHLQGYYAEKGQLSYGDYRFTIYEPNGTLHPDGSGLQDGDYAVTSPLVLDGSAIRPALADEIRPVLTVQKQSGWTRDARGSRHLENIFQAALVTKSKVSQRDAFALLYTETLRGQVAPLVAKGEFFTRTDNLYAYASTTKDGVIPAQMLETQATLQSSGATEDVYITTLEKNVPQRIRMFIWLEGQDADCLQDAANASFALSIELAGSN